MIGNTADPRATQSSPQNTATRPGRLRRRLAAGFAVLIGCAMLAATPALADHKHNKWKHHDKYSNDRYWNDGRSKHRHNYYHNDRGPRVVYIEEPRYYVVPAPRYHPAPVVYSHPSINIVVPLFD